MSHRGGDARAGASPAWAFRLALALFAGLGLFVALTFRHYGISNDEEVQHTYGRLLLDFYGSGFADRSAFEYKNLYLYGGLFDMIAAALERLLPGENLWDLRHLLSALWGLAGFAGAWLLARRLAGEWAASMALLLLLVTGAWTGAIFTHTKDVPFAAAMVWSLYFIVRIAPQLPRPAARHIIGLGIALGCAFGIRVGAVFAVFYLAATLLVASLCMAGNSRERFAFIARALVSLVPAAAIAIALMGLFWPWAVMAPENLYKAATSFSHFAFDLDTIIDGVVMNNGDVPGTYLSRYMLVRLPELFLLGIVLAAMAGLRALPGLVASPAARRNALPWFAPVLAVAFPLVYTLLAAPPLYNGIRHFTFLLPPLAVLGGAGFTAAWAQARNWPRARLLAAAACVALAVSHGVNLARLHPYEYLAYNRLAGGLQGTSGRWEQDYWAATLREAAEQLNDFVAREGDPDAHYEVAACSEPIQAEAWLDAHFEVTPEWDDADFYLSPTQMDCNNVLKGTVIATVVREGVTLAEVRDRRMLTGHERLPR